MDAFGIVQTRDRLVVEERGTIERPPELSEQARDQLGRAA